MSQKRKTEHIRAGWEIRLRVHGVRSETPLVTRYMLTVHSALTEYHVELAEEPLNFSMRFALPPYLVSGQPAPPFSNEPPPLPAGSWLTVVAARKLLAPANLVEAFKRAPGNPKYSNELVECLHAELDALRAAAEVFVGVFAVELAEVQPALWHEGSVLWFTDIDNRRMSDATARVLVDVPSVDRDMLTRLAALTAALSAAPPRVSTVVTLCSRWLIQAHAMPHFTNERFVSCFHALEALCTLADGGPSASDDAGFAALEETVSAVEGRQRAVALAFLKVLRQRCLAPPLTERFRRLAKEYQPETVDAHVAQFHAVRKARNGLLHGRSSSIPVEVDGVKVHDVVNDLASRYLGAVMNAIAEQHPVSIHAGPQNES